MGIYSISFKGRERVWTGLLSDFQNDKRIWEINDVLVPSDVEDVFYRGNNKDVFSNLNPYSAASGGIPATGVTVNSDDPSLVLSERGYYNYIGGVNAIWPLPAASDNKGKFYRIYNKCSDQESSLTLAANGSDEFFRGGVWSSTIPLSFGENLTVHCDGNEWNVYG